MTKKQNAKRKKAAAQRKRRDAQDPEEKAASRSVQRASETPEQRKRRLDDDRSYRREARAGQTPGQTRDRRLEDLTARRSSRASETPGRRNERLAAERQARCHQQHQEASCAAPTEWNYTRDELYAHLHTDTLHKKGATVGDVDAALATDFEFDPYKATVLWYTNSGYDRYDRLLKFDATPEQWDESRIKQHYEDIEKEVQQEILTDSGIQDTLKTFAARRACGRQNLPACAACGIRKLVPGNSFFVERQLDDLPGFMKLNDTELCDLKLVMKVVQIPVDEAFTLRSVDVSKAVSWYQRGPDGDYYHLHPELVSERDSKAFVCLCKTCDSDMFSATNPKRPRYSIASGIDFGCYHRLGLETPNIHDIAIIARIRRYGKIVKIRPSSVGQRNYTRDQLTTHMTMFEHDAPYIAAKLFYCDKVELQQYITEALHLHFMDAEGNLDNLTYATYQTTTILGRCYVVYQWLQVLSIINRQYYDVELPPYAEFLELFENALDDIVNAGTVTTDREDIERDLGAGSDVAAARAAHAFPTDGNRGGPCEPAGHAKPIPPKANIALRRSTRRTVATTVTQSFVTEADLSTKEAPDESLLNATLLQNIQIAAFADHTEPLTQQPEETRWTPDNPCSGGEDDASASSRSGTDDSAHTCGARTRGTSVRTVRESNIDQSEDGSGYDAAVDPNISSRQHNPLNEYTHGEFILCAGFPNVFLLGKAYKRWAADLHEGELDHLMSQFTNVPAQDRPTLFYIADALRRKAAAKGMETRVKGDRASLQRFADMVKDASFEADLNEAILKPTGGKAKSILKKFLPILNVAGRHIPHGAVSSSIILQKIMEISRRFASPFMMLTMSPSDLDNPTAMQMSIHTTNNTTFPATLRKHNSSTGSLENLDLRAYMKDEMTLHGTGSIKPISFHRNNRAKLAADNPIAYMREYKELLVDILSTLVGLPPCDIKSSRTDIANRKTRNFRTRKTGLFGTVLAYYGVNECHQKGTMHFHLAMYGGIGADILQKYCGVQDICDAIAAALDSQYKAEIPAGLHVHKLVKDSLASVAPGLCPDHLMATRHTNCTLMDIPDSTELTSDTVASFAGMQLVCKQVHRHTFTCYKGFNGVTGCRMCMPRDTVPATAPVLVEEAILFGPEGEPIDTFQVTQQSDLPLPDFTSTQGILDAPDTALIVWELRRSDLNEALPPIRDQDTQEQRSEMQLANLELHNDREFNTFLATLDRKTLDALYRDVCRRLEHANGMVVDYSPGFAFATGSHHNTAFLGASEQGKSAVFYISSYFGKNKAKVEETLSLLRNCIHHVAKFPSTAPMTARYPSGTDIRTAQHILTRTMNQATVRMGLSDCQAAAVIIDLRVEISSEIFSYCKPYNHIAYTEWDRVATEMEEHSDRDFEAFNDLQDELERRADTAAQGASDEDSFISENDDYRNCDDSYDHICALQRDHPDYDSDFSSIGSACFSTLSTSDNGEGPQTQRSPSRTREHSSQSSVSTEAIQPPIRQLRRPTTIAPEMFSSFGPARTFVVDQQQSKKKVAVPYTYHYRSRGVLLRHLNRFEYQALVIICDRSKKKEPEAPRISNRGRPRTQVFPFGNGHPLQGSHVQCLRSKQTTLICSGKAPKPPGCRPLLDARAKAVERWQVKATAFAKYYLVMFRVLEDVYDNSSSDTADYSWEAFLAWKTTMEADKSLIAKFRLQSMYNHMWGLHTPFKSKKLLSKYRGRSRTIWSQEQRNHFATEQWLEAAGRDADHAQTEEDFQRDHSKLSTASARSIQNSTLDDRHQYLQLVHATSSLLTHATEAPNDASPGQSPSSIPYSTRADSPYIFDGEASPLEIAVRHDDIHRFRPTNGNEDKASEQQTGATSGAPPTPSPNGLADHIRDTRATLNEEQAAIFDAYAKGFACESEMPQSVLITGAPGTGKTFLVNAIRGLGHHVSSSGDVVSTSFNAIAAIAAGGDTLSSIARPNFVTGNSSDNPAGGKGDDVKEIHVYSIKDLTDTALEQFIIDIKNDTIVLLIIDEISTVPPLMLYTLHRRCCQARGGDLPFGGIPVLYVGDFSQLGPVRGTPITKALVEMALHDEERKRQLRELRVLFPQRENVPPSGQPRQRDRRAESLYDPAHPFRKGCELITQAKWWKLTTQVRTDDEEHIKLLRKMELGEKLKVPDFLPYDILSKDDYADPSAGWINAPILVATNRERYTITAHMTTVFAKAFGKHVIRWPARHRKWEQAPHRKFHAQVIDGDGAFWEYFVQDADGFITDNVNKHLKLVNGTRIRYHSLAFDSQEQAESLRQSLLRDPPGSTITLPEPPHSINVILVDEELEDDADSKEANTSKAEQAQRAAQRASNIDSWADRTMVPGRIVVPLIRKRYKSKRWDTAPIPAGRGFQVSRVQVSAHFPVEPGFSITIHKSQSRTLRKVIIALSEHAVAAANLQYASVYVAMSRVRKSAHIRLLLHDRGHSTPWMSLLYLSRVKPDKHIKPFFAGFGQRRRRTGAGWRAQRAAAAFHQDIP